VSFLKIGSRLKLGLAAAGLVSLAACGGSNTPTASSSPSPSTAPGNPAADVTITINGMSGSNSYSPSPGAVKVGQTVAWKNNDSIAHTATGASFDTGSISPGATSRTITFSAAGNVDYHCSFHPSMVGTLTVQ
jgi:plastocyanin